MGIVKSGEQDISEVAGILGICVLCGIAYLIYVMVTTSWIDKKWYPANLFSRFASSVDTSYESMNPVEQTIASPFQKGLDWNLGGIFEWLNGHFPDPEQAEIMKAAKQARANNAEPPDAEPAAGQDYDSQPSFGAEIDAGSNVY
jgi:hypothetical protein